MWWSGIEGIRNEYRGWCKFKTATGEWPICSVLAGLFSIPVLFAIGAYCFVAARDIGRPSFIYGVLFPVVICGAIVWYALRRAARAADVARAKRLGPSTTSITDLEEFLR